MRLIDADALIEPKPVCEDAISRQAAIEALTGWQTDPTDEEIVHTLKALPPVEPKIYGNEHNCIMTIFGECSYSETGCGSCEVVEKVRDALAKTQMKTQNSNENSNEDAISRADTIKAMCSKCVIKEECIGECSDVVAIKNMPSVWSERPKGEWIEHIDEWSGRRYGECPLCNEITLNAIEYDLDGQRHIMNFCPKCGSYNGGENEA